MATLKEDVNCSVQFHIRKDQNVRIWLIDAKQPSQVTTNTSSSTTDTTVKELLTFEDQAIRPDVVVTCSDEVFMQLLTYKLSLENARHKGLLRVVGYPQPLLFEKVRLLLKIINLFSTK